MSLSEWKPLALTACILVMLSGCYGGVNPQGSYNGSRSAYGTNNSWSDYNNRLLNQTQELYQRSQQQNRASAPSYNTRSGGSRRYGSRNGLCPVIGSNGRPNGKWQRCNN